MSAPIIAVPAYNRPHALQRLLASLAIADYSHPVKLIIAIDAGGTQQHAVTHTAEAFAWTHGPKEIVRHPQNLGLIGNVFYCGRLALEHGAVILLEDDLVVSRAFYHYAQQALAAYRDEPRLAGLSLNTLWFNGYTHQPFVPYLDASDTFFVQVAWYQGQLYTTSQWQAFETWYTHHEPRITTTDRLHESFQRFPATDWFPLKMKYLADTGRFYAFPRQSLTTNFGDVGTHFEHNTPFFQVPLQHYPKPWQLGALDDSAAVYDTFQEMLPSCLDRLTDQFHGYAYDVDLYGTKAPQHWRGEYLLTTRPCHHALYSFGLQMWPPEANVVHGVAGNDIHFCQKSDLAVGSWSAAVQTYRLHRYMIRRRRPSRRQKFQLALVDLWHKWRQM